jgi:hypothetical protein
MAEIRAQMLAGQLPAAQLGPTNLAHNFRAALPRLDGQLDEPIPRAACEPGVKGHGEPHQLFIDCRHGGCFLRKRKK